MGDNRKLIRRGALLSPYGVGAIVPFPNDESLMIAGLDMWAYRDTTEFAVEDQRLQRRLGVSELRRPPDYRDASMDERNGGLTVPAVRFPTWYYCPYCGSMKRVGLYVSHPHCDGYPWPNGRRCILSQGKPGRRMMPERFVVICPRGHIADFPVAEWVHSDTGKHYDPENCHIRRSTGGASASLHGVYYECTCGAKKSIGPALQKDALKNTLGYTCRGNRPWLGELDEGSEPCGSEDVRVVLRGATNVWFAETVSSILIPTDGERQSKAIKKIVDQFFPQVSGTLVDGKPNLDLIEILAEAKNVDPDELKDAFQARLDAGGEDRPASAEDTSEDAYRKPEYDVLIRSAGSDAGKFHSQYCAADQYEEPVSSFFSGITLVHKLTETRAFAGFSRMEPVRARYSEMKKMLRLGSENWLPAIQTEGEGIFFAFSREKLEAWARDPKVASRAGIMQRSYRNSRFGAESDGDLRPEFVLIHTFAHLIINQLSFECGYGSSSIRERIYCEKDRNQYGMYGVLLYTASGDSDGSLGGLVRQGRPGRIEDTVLGAIRTAAWCSSDPVCIQSLGQGPDSCNLAACHNCALLPETCCEFGNRFLDRGMVTGTPEDRSMGFFSSLLES